MNGLYDPVFKLKTKLQEQMARKQALDFCVSLIANFHLACNPTFFSELSACFNSNPLEVLQSTDLDEVLYDTTNQLTTDNTLHFTSLHFVGSFGGSSALKVKSLFPQTIPS